MIQLVLETHYMCFRQASSMVFHILIHIRHLADLWIDTGAAKLGRLLRE